MKIRKLHLKNIGVFNDQEIVFQPCKAKDKAEIHIFTGQNGSGKSTILMGLANSISNFSDETNRSFYRRFNHKHSRTCEIEVSFDDETFVELIENLIVEKDFVAIRRSPSTNRKLESYLLYRNSSLSKLSFAAFAFSGYREIKNERVEAVKEPNEFEPLSQSLEFDKDYRQDNQVTINQLIANNISKSAIERTRNKEKSERFAKVVESIERIIWEITNWRVEFDLRTEPLNLIIRINGKDLNFDVLPDGLRSLISWIADLLGKVDLLKWQDDLPIFEKNLILFLDEIEVHLHPAWQRKVLPVVQKLFKNSQIFISTHSPFVINSIDDAWVYKLELENGKARVAEVVKSEDGHSYSYVLSEIFDIKEEFGIEVQKDLAKFKELRNKILASNNGSEKSEKELLKLAKSLAVQSEELQTIVQLELRQINKRTGKSLAI
jgi:predicted ATP-binding protein involved in virulence